MHIGVEEEYFLVTLQTKEILHSPPENLLKKCQRKLSNQVKHEFFSCQLEAITPKCSNLSHLKDEITHMREALKIILAEEGIAIVASSTYPSLLCSLQQVTDQPYYHHCIEQFSFAAKKLLVNGLHIHMECLSDRKRISLLNKTQLFLPLFLSLSASSPFFEEEDSKMESVRTLLMQQLPSCGIIQPYLSLKEYNELLAFYDQFELKTHYGPVRISRNYPTLEMRICDACPDKQTSWALASLYAALIQTLLKKHPKRLPFYTENRDVIDYFIWQSARHPINEVFYFNFSKKEKIPFLQTIEILLNFVLPEAKKLKCISALDHIHDLASGHILTSAQRQKKIYQNEKNLMEINEHLINETNI